MKHKKVSDKKTVMLIPPLELPIPSVGGGAIETLITSLLDINERERKLNFVVISKYDKCAFDNKYLHSTICYFKNERYIGWLGYALKLHWIIYRILYEIFQSGKIFKPKHKKDKKSFLVFQCLWILKKYSVDFVVFEGRGDESMWGALKEHLKPESIFTHIHCFRPEVIIARKVAQNSISISKFVKNNWSISKEISGKDIVLYNGVDVDKMGQCFSEDEIKNLRTRYGINSDEIVVIFCGRIIKEKGVMELLDAFELLKEYPIKLLLIGSVGFSTDIETEYSKEVNARSSEMQNVIKLGYIPNEKMPYYYAISDIHVIPSTCEEGAGLVAVEGMSAGLPLIITISGGMVEYADKKTSIQIPINKNLHQNIANAILELANDKEKRESMGKAGRKRAYMFTKEKYYSNFVDIFSA